MSAQNFVTQKYMMYKQMQISICEDINLFICIIFNEWSVFLLGWAE